MKSCVTIPVCGRLAHCMIPPSTTNKAEIRPEEQSEKTESCRENLWNEITVERAIKREIDTRTELKGVGKLGWLMSDKGS